MAGMTYRERAVSAAAETAMRYIAGDPEENLPRLLHWAEAFDKNGVWERQLTLLRSVLGDRDSVWYQYVMQLYRDIDRAVLQRTFRNFLIHAALLGYPKQRKLEEKLGCNIPWTLLIDPTSACNLKCTGCWAAEYGGNLQLSYEELNNVIRQAKDLGIRFFPYSGGEPLVRRADLLRLCEVHEDCQFAAFTNGTLIDEAFAEDLLRVKNFVPIISVEGFEEETDLRRGRGTFEKVERAMALLRKKKLPFGASCCYTWANVEVIGSEAYFDQLIAWGAKFCWFFTYMPVGKKAVPELMVTAAQRKYMYEQVRRFRRTKPLFTLDFWNDGEYAGGCLAGGRRYLHVNANGDLEPCAFIHYSDSNLREKTLPEALRSPLFMAYRRGQPFHENHLRPCPLLDQPGALARAVQGSGAHSTDLQAPEEVTELSEKCAHAAREWAPVADALWMKAHPRRNEDVSRSGL